ncbi:hypothetical protein AAH990_07350 [Enterococcus lactis]|uniref:hypothetical protein n=1 Tax=Enterococcus TaxID=1350 RepID=UPI00064CD272|nr:MULTISPECIES: hypothetical protein [Enterococcus]MBX8935210.1 hypothetical protein [Enterobacter sp. K62_1]HAW87777.1 hypothetical protein [Enterococcus sp.]EGP4796427.1 hypothetical protein [Enterococcus faecium]EGP4907894.1 hypothetical protein [Enterococcus faecium]EGP5117761.1 hypothetical protein [Enterococcus faecium]
MIRKMLIIFVTTIVVSSLVLTSTAIVSLASELDTTTIKADVYKNDSYIDANGNRETGRITLTEARWSSTYDFRW